MSRLPRWAPGILTAVLTMLLPMTAVVVADEQPDARAALWKKLEPFAQPPAEFVGKLGPYRSPLKFADGSVAKTPADWNRRRAEIRQTWHKRLGPWPALV